MNSDQQKTIFPIVTDKHELEAGTVLAPRFDEKGLVTAVVMDAESHEILMLAHMNAEALKLTLETGKSHFWSRSRQQLWLKGETSGNIQEVREIRIDCDQDAIVLIVDVQGSASCHTGARSCFFRKVTSVDDEFSLTSVDECGPA